MAKHDKKNYPGVTMNKVYSKFSKLSLPFAVFGFLLIIATGSSMILNEGKIPLFVSFIGLILIVLAMILRKKGIELN